MVKLQFTPSHGDQFTTLERVSQVELQPTSGHPQPDKSSPSLRLHCEPQLKHAIDLKPSLLRKEPKQRGF